MAVPPQVTQWIARTYPKPQIDSEWLSDCYGFLIQTQHLDPVRDLDQIIQAINFQLLASSLTDSMTHFTGLPRKIGSAKKATVGVPPVLVQITSITEIGHSAFTLQNTRQTRIDRADLAGLAEEDGGEDDGPIPRYPRSMLKFRISDGSTEIEAIEYRKIPELELGVTPLGYKLLLKGVKIKRGIAFLEPGNVVLLGHREDELEGNRERIFLESLHMRLHPDEPFVEPADLGAEGRAAEPAPAPPQPAPVQAPPQPAAPPPARLAPNPPAVTPVSNTRPKPPSTANQPSAPPPPAAGPSRMPDTQSTLVNSPYFASAKALPPSANTRETTVVDEDVTEDADTEMEDVPPPPAPSGSDYFFDDVDDNMLAWADELEAEALSQQQQQRASQQQQQPASQGASQPSSQTMPGSQGRAVPRTVSQLFSSQGSRAEGDGQQSPPKKRLKVSTGRRTKPQSNGPPVRTITQLFGSQAPRSQPARAAAPVHDDSIEEIQPKPEPPSTQTQTQTLRQTQKQKQPQLQVAGSSTATQEPARPQRRTETPPAAQSKAASPAMTQATTTTHITSTQTGPASRAVSVTQVHDVIEIDDTETEDESSAPPSSQMPPSSQWERYRRVAPGVGSFLDLT